jgi:hypothetical protein
MGAHIIPLLLHEQYLDIQTLESGLESREGTNSLLGTARLPRLQHSMGISECRCQICGSLGWNGLPQWFRYCTPALSRSQLWHECHCASFEYTQPAPKYTQRVRDHSKHILESQSFLKQSAGVV